MLKFDRKEFMSGVQIVKYMDKGIVPGPRVEKKNDKGETVLVDGPLVEAIVEKTRAFTPGDKGKSFEFLDEKAVLAAYPVLFTEV